MKTNVILVDGKRLSRFYTAQTLPADHRLTAAPRYHEPKPRIGLSPAEPALIRLGDYGFDLTRGGVIKPAKWGKGAPVTAVVISDEAAAHLDALDTQIAALAQRRLEVMTEAVKVTGRLLTRADAVDMKARREAAAAGDQDA